MGKIIITKDSRKKCDLIIGKAGIISNGSGKNLVVRLDDDDKNPCKATRIILGKIQAGGGEIEEDGD